MKIAIVTSSSDKYFHLACELIQSIKKNKESKKISICFIERNLCKKNILILKNKFKIKYISPVLNIYKNINIDPVEYAQICLPKYFPEFDKYIWIDSDAWVNSWDGVELLISASKNDKFAVSSMGDRHTNSLIRVDWIFRNLGLIKSQNFKHSLKMSVPLTIARKIGLKPHLNAGVFALNKKSIFWKLWINNFKNLKGPAWGKNQLAMNLTVYQNEDRVNILPHYINCIPNLGNVVYDVRKKIFLEKYAPHNKIGIIHLASGAPLYKNSRDFRFDNHKIKIETADGKFIFKTFRFKDE